jgi:FkbM family methyltransferase
LGANAGYTAAHFAHLYSDAQIIALEMDSANFRMAETNTRPWCSRVRLCHAAAWSVDGHVTYEPVGNEDAYHVDFGVQAKPGCQGREVDARGIDSILEECKIGFVDYVKMDVEGAEEEILLNRPGNWLRRVGSMKVEVHNGADMAPYMRSLESFGFHCRKDLDHWR